MWDPEAQEINDQSFQSPDNSMPFARYPHLVFLPIQKNLALPKKL